MPTAIRNNVGGSTFGRRNMSVRSPNLEANRSGLTFDEFMNMKLMHNDSKSSFVSNGTYDKSRYHGPLSARNSVLKDESRLRLIK